MALKLLKTALEIMRNIRKPSPVMIDSENKAVNRHSQLQRFIPYIYVWISCAMTSLSCNLLPNKASEVWYI